MHNKLKRFIISILSLSIIMNKLKTYLEEMTGSSSNIRELQDNEKANLPM